MKQHKKSVVFILITAMLDVISLGIVLPIFPRLLEEFIASPARVGLINGLFVAIWALMQWLASPILGALSDRFGRRPIILFSTVGLSIDYIIMALAPDLWWLVIGRILGGLTSSTIGTVYAYMTDITTEEQRVKAFGWIGAAFSTGFILGPVIGGIFGEINPRLPFWIAAGLNAIAFAYGVFVLPESLPLKNRTPFSWKQANPVGAVALLLSSKKLFSLASINFVMTFCHYVYHAVFVLYTAHRYGFSSFNIGLLLALTAALDVMVQVLLVGQFSKRMSQEKVLMIGLFGGAMGMAWIGLAPTKVQFIIAFFPLALWGLALPALQSLMTKMVSPSEQGKLQGANTSIISLAGIVAPLIFGGVYSLFIGEWSHFNLPGAPFLLATILLVICAFMAKKLIRKSVI